ADPDIRKTKMGDHHAFLESNGDLIEAAGPLADASRKGRDGLWIVEASDRNRLEELIREDPFWPTGLRKSYAIIPWTRVYADGRRLIEPE
ncbi:MAG: YciI family protein, partial [Pseudomonadota bacterium]